MKYPVIVQCNKTQYKKIKRQLKKSGLKWDGDSVAIGNASKYAFKRLQRKCEANNIPIRINNSFSSRNNSYRSTFYKNIPPHIGKYYFCSYCGSLISIDKITVDHLYPVAELKRNIRLYERFKKKGYSSVNDIRNLVPSCAKCNKRKGQKTGIWILKGRIGRHPWIWVIRHIVRLALFVGICICLFYVFCHTESILEYLEILREWFRIIIKKIYL